MYDEDRQTALTMYERMFDETADEQGLVQLLVSPTRQAVVLARSYDAKERKLQIESRSRDDNYTPDPEDVPSFVFIIDKTAKQAAELGVKDIEVSEDQFSIFDEPGEAPEADAGEEAEGPLPAPIAAAEEAEAADAEAEAQAEELSDVEETANAVDAFLADFSVENGELVFNKTEDEEEAPEVPAEEGEAVAVAEPEAEVEDEAVAAPVYKTKTNILLLILYTFFAIPVSLIGIAVLLVPAVLLLALAISLIGTGVSVFGMCFGNFAVIADLMVVLGAGLIISALGLLFAWLFIWFIIRVIFGFIRGVCRLGRRICCKEVAVQ